MPGLLRPSLRIKLLPGPVDPTHLSQAWPSMTVPRPYGKLDLCPALRQPWAAARLLGVLVHCPASKNQTAPQPTLMRRFAPRSAGCLANWLFDGLGGWQWWGLMGFFACVIGTLSYCLEFVLELSVPQGDGEFDEGFVRGDGNGFHLVELSDHGVGYAFGLIKRTAFVAGSCVFAFGGALIGGIAGAMKGQTT
ncbi:hypothetical protein Droror1_Dr00010408 [Drosera rotundifolia]